MGSLLKTVGFGGTNDPVIKRATGILSDGSSVMMVADMNQVGVSGDGGDNTGVPKLYIYHSTDRVAWTLKATVNTPATTQNLVSSMCVDSANNIHIAYRGLGGAFVVVNYVKLTFSAGPAWAVGAAVALNTAAPTGYTYMSLLDIDTIGGNANCVVVGAYWYQTVTSKKTAVVAYVRTTAGAWVTHATDVMISGDSHLGYADDFTLSGDNISTIGADNVGLFVYHTVRKGSSGTDFGDVLQLVRVNCSTGARIALHTIYGGRFAGVGGGFRKFWLFNTAANQWDLCGIVDSADFKTALYRFSWNRTSNAYTSHVPISLSAGRGVALSRGSNNHNWCSVVGNGQAKYTFFAISSSGAAINGTGKITNDGKVTFDPGILFWDNRQGDRSGYYTGSGGFSRPTVATARQVFAGATRNLSLSRIEAMIFYFMLPVSVGVTNYRMEARSVLPPNAPDGITPAAGSTVSTDRPILSANFRMQLYYPQYKTEMEWALASDAGFTTNLRTVTEEGTDFVAASGTVSPYNATVNQTETLTAIEELFQGTWYIRARSVDWAGNYGPWSSSQTFVVTHPPVGADLYPTGGAVFLYAGVGNVTFSWRFTDPSPYDNQTAYRVAVERTDDSSIVADSGKIAFSASAGAKSSSATLAIPVSGKDVELRWKLTLWDSDDVMGPETPYQAFYVTDPPAPTFTSPAPGTVLTTGIPTVTWNPGIGGTKTQARYRVFLTQGASILYSSNWVSSIETSHTLPVGYLVNDQSYTIRLEIQDNLGLQGFTEVAVSTDWIEPAGPANDWEVYVNEYAKRGFVYITWTDANMDADFASWNVYRRLVGEPNWTQVATVSSGAGRYAHRDYFIGSGRTYEYTVTQMVDRFGDYIESSPAKIVRVTPDADNYWLIDPLVPSNSIPLYQVTADPFSEEYEQETIHIIGAGRHVEYGDRLGYSGTISSSLRDKFVSGSVRQNYVLNPAMAYQSANGAVPDKWFYASAGSVGEASQGYYATQNPSPSGKTPYRIYADAIGTTGNDNIRVESSISGSDFPDRMKVPGATVVLSAWVAVSALNSDKRYRLSVAWLDAAGAQMSQVDSPALHPILDGVGSYIPASGTDAAAGNAVEVWRRIRFITTVPAGTPPAGATVKARLMGNGGTVSPGELIMGGIQFEMDQMTDYFDGDQFGGEWSGEPYLSYSYGNGYYTARQQRQALERIKAQKTWVYLRNPFGDLWRVAPGNISVTRIAGVGKSEFVNVSMPYEEVKF